MKFKDLPADLLEQSYQTEANFSGRSDSRLAFVGDHIFDFTTYDSEMSELFAAKALEVCAAISEGRTFDYIKNTDNYRWFLLMANMPFFARRLEWGTSIRGAWWDHEDRKLESCGLFVDQEQVLSIEFTRDDWLSFINALITFTATGVRALGDEGMKD